MVHPDEMRSRVQAVLPDKRWRHTQGVIASAIELATRYGADIEKAEVAAVLHDVAKYWPTEQMRALIDTYGLPPILLEYDKELWHAPVGAVIAERDFGVTDEDTLNAIRFHTSGREGMSILEQVVCLADYIEPGRDYPTVERIRVLAETSLQQALMVAFDSTISLLIQRQQRIFPLTVAARNDLIQQIQAGQGDAL